VKVVRLSSEAIDELVEAAGWYQSRRPGLESEFLAEVDRLLPLIGGSPAAFPRLLDVPADLVIRRALLPRFPYALIFMNLGEDVRVLAVAHAKTTGLLDRSSRRRVATWSISELMPRAPDGVKGEFAALVAFGDP
jgi:hypothetical protein